MTPRAASEGARGRMDIRLKRVYEPATDADGHRVLVERLWPRGVSRERARLDEWDKELPPSTNLRQWFGHDPGRFEEFRQRYLEELRHHRRRIAELRRRARGGTLTLVYSASDTEHNDAVVLADVLRRGLPRPGARRSRLSVDSASGAVPGSATALAGPSRPRSDRARSLSAMEFAPNRGVGDADDSCLP